MELKCNRCKKQWPYRGKITPREFPQYTSCPRCKTSVKINQIKGEPRPGKPQGNASIDEVKK